jgi:hypothetical protein
LWESGVANHGSVAPSAVIRRASSLTLTRLSRGTDFVVLVRFHRQNSVRPEAMFPHRAFATGWENRYIPNLQLSIPVSLGHRSAKASILAKILFNDRVETFCVTAIAEHPEIAAAGPQGNRQHICSLGFCWYFQLSPLYVQMVVNQTFDLQGSSPGGLFGSSHLGRR